MLREKPAFAICMLQQLVRVTSTLSDDQSRFAKQLPRSAPRAASNRVRLLAALITQLQVRRLLKILKLPQMPPRRAQPYTPPHRRQTEDTEPQTAALSLDALALDGSIQVQVVLEDASDWTGCPFSVPPAEQNAPTQRMVTLPDEDELAEDLLGFFRDSAGACAGPEADRCKLVLPASLSKERRKAWHKLSKGSGLQSVSQGIGEARHLQIGLPDSAAVGPKVKSVSAEAKRLWSIAQEAGGTHWQRSLAEIQHMIDHNSAELTELRGLDHKRSQATQLEKAILRGEGEAALQLLAQEPDLVWLRASPHGNYPLIEACRRVISCLGMVDVVRDIVRRSPGAVQQRSRQYQSALVVVSQHPDPDVQNQLQAALVPPK